MKKKYGSAQEHIKDLYNRKAKNDENSTTLAKTLESNIETAFKGEHKFIFELLQNADDSAEETKTNISIKLTLLKEKAETYFVFEHSGKHFDQVDVEKICNNAQDEFEGKSVDSKKIGYKGIGFKAVYTISEQVFILSKDYRFCFDKSHFNSHKGAAFPWPIIPIWTENNALPNLKDITPQNVTFIFKIKRDINIESELNFIKQNPTIMLFLRRVNLIEVVNGKEITLINLVEKGNQKEIYVNKKLFSSWISHSIEFDLSTEIKQKLKKLSESECPQRLKNADRSQITFIAELKDGKIVKCKESQLYCYLPTQVKYGFSYIVNADFLLTSDRARVIENDWNQFLMEKIAYAQFQWLANLANNPDYSLQIFQLLSKPVIKGQKLLADGYAKGYQQAISNVKFIPSHGENPILLLVNEVVVDETRFCHGLDNIDHLTKKTKLLSGKFSDADNKLFLDLFKENIARHIDIKNLHEAIVEAAGINVGIATQHYILSFLNKHYSSNRHVISPLGDRNFILSNDGKLQSPKALYFKTDELIKVKQFIKLDLVNDLLEKHSEILKILGVSDAEPARILEHFIQNIILKGGLTKNNCVEITRYIFQYRNKLDGDDLASLKSMPIMTLKENLCPASKCYLADKYQPFPLLETVLSEDIFVSSKYVAEGELVSDWAIFFERIGVKTNLKVRIINSDYTTLKAEERFLDPYIDFTNIRMGGDSDKHAIRNFLTVDLIEYASNLKFIDIFLQKMLSQWDMIQNALKNPTLYLNGRKESKLTNVPYLQYFLQNKIYFQTSFTNKYLSKDLLAPNFYSVCGKVLPTAKLNIQLTKEQENFIGFKERLTVDDCLKVLNHLNESKEVNPENYESILRAILIGPLTQQDKEKLMNWQGKLLAQDNSLQPVAKLRFYKLTHVEPPRTSAWLKNFSNLHFKEMEEIAVLFNILSIDEKSIKLSFPGEKVEWSNLAKNKVSECIRIIAIIEAMQLNSDPEEQLMRLTKLLNELKFISTSRFSIEINHVVYANIGAYIFENCLYFTKRYFGPDFCNALGKYLSLSQIAIKNMQELMQLETDDLEDYLLNHQIDKTLVNTFCKLDLNKVDNDIHTPVKQKNIEISPSAGSENEEGVRQILSERSDFHVVSNHLNSTPQSQPDGKILFQTPNQELLPPGVKASTNKFVDIMRQVNTNTIKIRKITPQKSQVSRISGGFVIGDDRQQEALSKKDRAVVGRIGEIHVYSILEQHYRSKYPSCLFTNTDAGFKLTKEENQQEFKLEVSWHNKGRHTEDLTKIEDSGLPKDFTITKTGKEERVIEVKATPHDTKKTFHISGNEFELMKKMGNRYRIFRVFGIGSLVPNIGKIKNPAKDIEDGKIEIKTYEIKL